MKHLILLLILAVFLSCKENVLVEGDNPAVDIDNYAQTEKENAEVDEIDEADETEVDADSDFENPDVDMYCPIAINANYPYYKRDGTIHFCRPCDTPDEYDPQCVKSLWKDLNKEVYDKYKAGVFEESEYLKECFPWPCEWEVTPTSNEEVPTIAHEKCDTFLNPKAWTATSTFSGSRRESNMDNGKVVFRTSNYRITGIETTPYQGQRGVLYDIETGKYEVISILPGAIAYMNGMVINDITAVLKKTGSSYDVGNWILSIKPYKESYKYEVIYKDDNNRSKLDTFPYFTKDWTVMVVNHLDKGENPRSDGNRSLIYAKTGEWKWTTLAYGNLEGKAGEISISGDKAMFVHVGTMDSYICDLSKAPKSIDDCKKISREGEAAGFPRFDRDNPNRIIYRPVADGIPYNRFVIMDISKEPWVVEKEFDIPSTEGTYLRMQLSGFKSNVLLYKEDYVLNASGYQEDAKLCFYRIDKNKTYCSKPLAGQEDYGHGYSSFDEKYLFWQPAYNSGYILRDMECYCKEEGVCPFEE